MIYLQSIAPERNRFRVYRIERDGKNVSTAWGRFRPTTGQVHPFKTEAEAINFVKKKLRQQIRKGYLRVVCPQERLGI